MLLRHPIIQITNKLYRALEGGDNSENSPPHNTIKLQLLLLDQQVLLADQATPEENDSVSFCYAAVKT